MAFRLRREKKNSNNRGVREEGATQQSRIASISQLLRVVTVSVKHLASHFFMIRCLV